MDAFEKKAIERINLAKKQIESGDLNTLGSTLYFSLFNFMQAVLKEPETGKWKHIGINKSFLKFSIENGIFDRNLLKNIARVYEDLYFYRRISDYENRLYTDEEVRELIVIFHFLKEVFEKWRKQKN